MPVFVRVLEAAIDFRTTITDATFDFGITNGVVPNPDEVISFNKSRIVDNTVFIQMTTQTGVPTGSSAYLLDYTIYDVTDGQEFGPVLTNDAGIGVFESNNNVMQLGRFSNFTRFIVMNLTEGP